MLRASKFTIDSLLRIVILTCSVCAVGSAIGQELDPQQDQWIRKYQKQVNAPNPGEMLLNADSEPDLSTGFVSLFNGTDLTGWQPKGGTCSFELKDGQIVGTCVPGSASTYLCTERTDFGDFVLPAT